RWSGFLRYAAAILLAVLMVAGWFYFGERRSGNGAGFANRTESSDQMPVLSQISDLNDTEMSEFLRLNPGTPAELPDATVRIDQDDMHLLFEDISDRELEHYLRYFN